jgi:hypothetical protein
MDEKINEAVIKLSFACQYAVKYPDWKATIVKKSNGNTDESVTHCNQAVDYIAYKMGCEWFKDKNANQIYDIMVRNFPKFVPVEFPLAAKEANKGKLVIAAQKGKEHGHVAVLYPAEMEKSGTFGCMVPMVANVGLHNGVMRLSQGFKKDPYPKCFCFVENT